MKAKDNIKTELKPNKVKQMIMALILCLFVLPMFSVPMLRLKMNGLVNSLDETVIYYQAGASNGFDAGFDAYYLIGPNPSPHIAQQINNVLIAVNGIAPVCGTFSIQIKATTHLSGNFTITASDFEDLPLGTTVILKDLIKGIEVNILTSPYAFVLESSTINARFVLLIEKNPIKLEVIQNVQQKSCNAANAASISVMGLSNGPWNYFWKDSMGIEIKNSLNLNSADSLINLDAGKYQVKVQSKSACAEMDTSFEIKPISIPKVAFTSNDSLVLGKQKLKLQNTSVNCNEFVWDFGEGKAISKEIEPNYNYVLPGLYKIKLQGKSVSGCLDSASKIIRVLSLATALKQELSQNSSIATLANNQYKVVFNQSLNEPLNLQIISLNAGIVLNDNIYLNEEKEVLLDLNNYSKGIYIINISNNIQVLLNWKVLVK